MGNIATICLMHLWKFNWIREKMYKVHILAIIICSPALCLTCCVCVCVCVCRFGIGWFLYPAWIVGAIMYCIPHKPTDKPGLLGCVIMVSRFFDKIWP